MNLVLLGLSIALSVIGSAAALLIGRHEGAAKVVGCGLGLLASVASFASGALGIFAPAVLVHIPTMFSFADFTLLWNPLSGLLVCVISVLAFAAWIYGFSYFEEYKGKGIGKLCFFMNLFVASMILVVMSDNAFWFLVFFELMSLTSYFLVVFDQTEQSIKGGFLYFVMAHIGFMMIMVSFFTMAYVSGGSFEFSAFRETAFSPVVASIVFMLAFFGFGIKAGMVPFHSWLPQAHPAAPSNVSALMSGGMVKIGVFGVIKVGFDLLCCCQCELWWGVVVLIIGALSSILGIAYATAEDDIKRVLAYCTVENVGIIFVGVGVALIGSALNQPVIAMLGLVGALFHVANHALYKASLFFGAGSVMYRTHTRKLNEMGGLAKFMPATALLFLVSCLAVCAIPPLNGFASEWLIYQSLIDSAMAAEPVIQGLAVAAAAVLAITGAIAVVCFVKLYGVAFSGTARSAHAEGVREVPAAMTFATAIMVIGCVAFGVLSGFIVPAFEGIASSMVAQTVVVVDGGMLGNPFSLGAVSLLASAILLVVVVLLVQGVRLIANNRYGLGVCNEPWDCGYLPDTSMMASSGTFAAYAEGVYGPLYDVRDAVVERKGLALRAFDGLVGALKKLEPQADKYLVDGVTSIVEKIGMAVRRLAGGDYRRYISYVVVALAVLLIATVVAG